MTTLIQLGFSHLKSCELFYRQIAHLVIGIMLKAKKFNILLHCKIVFGEIAAFTACSNCCWGSCCYYCMGKLLLGKLLLGKLVIGEIVVGEVGCWGNCCWGSCYGEVVTGEVALGK